MLLGDLLRYEKFSKLTIVNKDADLNRIVSTIESTETPDIAAYLPKNTLLITTGMAFIGKQEELCELIQSLNALPCAGLAIKLGRYIDELHPDVIKLANNLNFPILQIPMTMTLGEVYKESLSYLWNDKNEELTFALNTQKKLTNLIIQGAKTKSILNNLGYILEKSVLIIDPFGQVVETNYTCNESDIELAQGLFEEYEIFKKGHVITNHFDETKKGRRKISIYPIQVAWKNSYYLYIFDSEQLSTAVSTMVVEQVLLILAIALHKQLYAFFVGIKNKEDFLNILLNTYKEETWSTQQILKIGKKFGVQSAPVYSAVLGTLETSDEESFSVETFSHREELFVVIFNWLEEELAKTFKNDVLVFPQTDDYRFVFIVQKKRSKLVEKLQYFHEKILQVLGVKMVFSIGDEMPDLDSIEYSYNEAKESYFEGHEKSGCDFIKYFKPKEASDLLQSLSREQSDQFCKYTLKALAYPKDDMLLELKRTLKEYLYLRCSVTETANKMFLHRNTIKYRIKRCESILSMDLKDPANSFQLLLALALVEELD